MMCINTILGFLLFFDLVFWVTKEHGNKNPKLGKIEAQGKLSKNPNLQSKLEFVKPWVTRLKP